MVIITSFVPSGPDPWIIILFFEIVMAMFLSLYLLFYKIVHIQLSVLSFPRFSVNIFWNDDTCVSSANKHWWFMKVDFFSPRSRSVYYRQVQWVPTKLDFSLRQCGVTYNVTSEVISIPKSLLPVHLAWGLLKSCVLFCEWFGVIFFLTCREH